MSDIPIDFSTTDLWLVNIAIALMMFGVSLGLTVDDFRRVREIPRAPVSGLAAQFLILPALTSAAAPGPAQERRRGCRGSVNGVAPPGSPSARTP